MDFPDEVTLEIFDKTNLEDLPNLCNSNAYYRGICNQEFWERKFRQEQTFLVNVQNNPRDWVNELLHSKASMEKARTIFSDFKAGRIYPPQPNYHEDSILLDLNAVNTVAIFPDFLDKNNINSLLLYSRVADDEIKRGGQIIIRNRHNPLILFEAYTRGDRLLDYSKILTEDQTLYLLFLFCYYSLKFYNVYGEIIYDN
jgi:hypothetical protein